MATPARSGWKRNEFGSVGRGGLAAMAASVRGTAREPMTPAISFSLADNNRESDGDVGERGGRQDGTNSSASGSGNNASHSEDNKQDEESEEDSVSGSVSGSVSNSVCSSGIDDVRSRDHVTDRHVQERRPDVAGPVIVKEGDVSGEEGLK